MRFAKLPNYFSLNARRISLMVVGEILLAVFICLTGSVFFHNRQQSYTFFSYGQIPALSHPDLRTIETMAKNAK